jgi:hypothetical protein
MAKSACAVEQLVAKTDAGSSTLSYKVFKPMDTTPWEGVSVATWDSPTQLTQGAFCPGSDCMTSSTEMDILLDGALLSVPKGFTCFGEAPDIILGAHTGAACIAKSKSGDIGKVSGACPAEASALPCTMFSAEIEVPECTRSLDLKLEEESGSSFGFGFEFGSFALDVTLGGLGDFGSMFGAFDFPSMAFDFMPDYGSLVERRMLEETGVLDMVEDALGGRAQQLEVWDDLLHVDFEDVLGTFGNLQNELSTEAASRGLSARQLVEDASMDAKQFVWKVPYGSAGVDGGHMEYGIYGQAAPDTFGSSFVKVAASETSFDHSQAAPLAAAAEGYDHTIMQAFHEMPAIAYCSAESIAQWSCPLCQRQPAVDGVQVVTDDDGDAKAFVLATTHANQPVVQVVLYGSMQPNLLKWASDAELVPFPGCEQCAVHKGFYDDYQDLSASLRQALERVLASHQGAAVQIMGQGFGAALAPFAALDLVGDFPVSAVLTLGKPRVGNVHFSDFYQASRAAAVSFRLVHWRDPLPHVPPMEMGFVHESQEVWYNEDSTKYKLCAGVEHPDCSDAVYVFNITDHLSFFGGDLVQTTVDCAGLRSEAAS